MNPETTLTSSFGLGATLTEMMGSMMTMLSTFFQLPENDSLYMDSYEIKAGRWPEDYNECVLVLSSTGTIADYLVYTLGLRDFEEYEELIDDSLNGAGDMVVEYEDIYSYDDVIGTTYKLVNSSDYYEYDSEYGVWTDKQDNESYMRQLVADGEDLTIVGVVQPLEDATAAILSEGINYPASLIEHVATVASESPVVQDQLNNPDINVLTGEEFGEDFSLDLESVFSIDDDALNDIFDGDEMMDRMMELLDFDSMDMDSLDFSEMFNLDDMDLSGMFDMSSLDLSSMFDMSSLDLSSMLDMSSMFDMSGMDLSGMLDLSSLDLDLSGLSLDLDLDLSALDMDFDLDMDALMSAMSSTDIDFSSMLANMDMSSLFNMSSGSMEQLAQQVMDGYNSYAASTNSATYTDLMNDFADYLNSSSGQSILRNSLSGMVDSVTTGITLQDVLDLLEILTNDSNWQDTLVTWILNHMDMSVTVTDLSTELMNGFESYASANGRTTAASLTDSFEEYLQSPEAMQMMSAGIMGMMDQNALNQMMSSMMDQYMQSIMDSLGTALESQLQSQMAGMMTQMQDQIEAQMASAMSGMTDQLTAQIQSQLSSAMSGMTDQMTAQIESQMSSAMSGMTDSMTAQIESQMSSSMDDMMSEMMDGMMDDFQAQLEDQMSESMSEGMSEQFADLFQEAMEDSMDGLTLEDFMGPDTDFMEAFTANMDEDSLLELMTSMSSAVGSSYEGVLADLGYVDYSNPSEIDIYPKDFDAKDGVTAIIDDYNFIVDEAGEEELEISYTDLVGTMMSTVSTIINLVTYVLVAFVAISLVVSSIMIGIITYISVLERTREIGILRALGASKRNVGRIFNAETFVVGLIAGILGVVVALLILIPVNMIVHNFVQSDSARAFLPPLYGIILIVLSVVLTLIGGIIPSRKASKMDPVGALRSE